jgi:hypothetical protein
MELQRQIVIISKKNNVSIPQIAANLRWKNRIKQVGLDDKKIEMFLNTMDTLGNKHSIPPTVLVNQLFSLIEFMPRENKEAHQLDEELKSRISKLRELNNDIETSIKSLEETEATVEEKQKRLKIEDKDLDQFHEISDLLQLYKYTEFSTELFNVVRALADINNLGYDAKVIVSQYAKLESLTKANEKLKRRLQEKVRELEIHKRKPDEEQARWKDHNKAFEIFIRLVKDGLKEEDIFTAAHILNNDFTPDRIKELLEEFRTCGSIPEVKLKLKREYEENDLLF